MKQCDWCGLLSDDDNVCRWCKKPFPDAKLPHGVEVAPRPLFGHIALLLVAIIACVGFTLSSVTHSENARAEVFYGPIMASHRPSSPVKWVHVAPLAPPKIAPGNRVVLVRPNGASNGSQFPDVQSVSLDPVIDGSDDAELAETAEEAAAPAMQLASANFGYREDESGSQMAAGTVIITNEGNVALSDFTINLQIDGTPHRLLPFNGNLRTPRTITDLVLEPGQSISIPVISDRPFTLTEDSLKTVVVRARGEEGGSLTETIDVP